jgi:hypothetical protein
MKVEKNIPLPPLPKRSGRPAAYPFRTMLVGESFFVDQSDKTPKPYASLKSSVSIANKKLTPKHFEIRRENRGARVFRTV